MTVPVPDQLEYITDANGVTKDFPYPKRFLQKDEIVVALRDIDGIDTPQILGTHYTIAGNSWPTGGTVSFYTAPQAPYKVVRYRMTQAKQTVVLNNLTRNDAPSVELQLDRLAMAIQDRGAIIEEAWGGLGAEIAARVHGDKLLNDRVDNETIDRDNGDKALASLINQQGEISDHFFESDTAVEFATIKPTFKIISTGGGKAPGDGDGGLYVDENNGSQRTIVDADGRTWYRIPDLMPDREFRSVNQQRLALVNNKLLAGGSLSIVCVGDSMTYGYDNFSANRLPPVNGDVATRAPIQYPSRLQDRLNALTKSSATVINRGFSGDTARLCFQRWTSKPTAELAVIMLGINDANGVAGATFTEFCLYMERLIQRYLLWGCGVVLLTAPGVDMANAAHPSARYSMYVRSLAKQYGCPLFESIEAVQYCIASEIHSDSVHYNHIGYAKFGDAVASFIMSGALAGIERKISSEVISSFSRYSEGIGIHAKNCNFFNNYNDSYATSGAVCGIQPGGAFQYHFI